MRASITRRLAALALALVLPAILDTRSARAAEDATLLLSRPSGLVAPEGIAFDSSDGSFWVTGSIDNEIRHYDAALNLIDVLPSPFPLATALGGIAYNSASDTLLVLEPDALLMQEMSKSGAPVGTAVALAVGGVPNPGGPFVRGLAFDPSGDDGLGSVYVVEIIGARVYELTLGGDRIRAFVHPDDPDGYPGAGAGAPAGGISLVFDDTLALTGIDLVGAADGKTAVRRLNPDGTNTGRSILLTKAGATDVGGLARAPYLEPATGNLYSALWGTSSAGGEIFAVDGALPALADLTDLVCDDDSSAGDIWLSWSAGQTYDLVRIERNGELLADLPGDALLFLDEGLAPGVYRYAVLAEAATLRTGTLECGGVVGAGHVADWTLMDGTTFILDLAEDGGGLIWASDFSNMLYVYDKELDLVRTVAPPFSGEDDELTGVAYRPETDTILVINAATSEIHEIDYDGIPVSDPVVAELPERPDDPPEIGAIEYDPAGNGGDGVIYAVDLTRAEIHLLARTGENLGSWVHPDELRVPTPDPSSTDTFCLGISLVPESGSPATALDIAGGTAFDRATTRFLRVDAASGTPLGFELPVADLLEVIPRVGYVSIQNSEFEGSPVAFVAALRANRNVLFRVDRTPPPITAVTDLECAQPDLVDRAVLSFRNHGPYDSVEIARDGVVIASLDGGADSFTDDDATPGRHRYRVTAIVGDVKAEARECDVRVGKGALLRRAFIPAAKSPYQMTRDPTDGSFVIAANGALNALYLYRFDADFNFLDAIPSPIPEMPWQVAALAIRGTATASELWTISWEVPGGWLEPQVFQLAAQDSSGALLAPAEVIEIAGAPPEESITYPCAMTWDSDRDEFWFLERNTDTFWRMSTGGVFTASFKHPRPPVQDFVFNIGLDFDPARGSFTATTAGLNDHQITHAIGMTESGVYTGERIELDAAGLNPLNGLARDGERLWVCGSLGSLLVIAELKAAGDLASPEDLTCEEPTAGGGVTLAWKNPAGGAYDDIVVRRGETIIATLAGDAAEYTDSGAGAGVTAYTVAGSAGGDESSPAACSLIVALDAPTFVRGDVNDSGAITLADPISGLQYLFLGAHAPRCLDMLDVDDNGAVGIADPIRLLRYLFLSGLPPVAPFPEAGADPTADDLPCE